MYEPGIVLAGKYRIERQLGYGGMGLVLAAEHIELRTTVAVKCLIDKYAQRADIVGRFLREARASAQLTSDHVCRVFDVGRLETGVPYFVMELLHGSDLAKVLRASGPVGVETATAYVLQVCDAIQEAHASKIIHRDLKPGNLFLTQRRDGAPLIKVLDFGIAKVPDEGGLNLTTTDTVLGSPSYMAPEQIRASKIADARSDIWSLGVILYELVSGRPPFRSASIGDLAIRIATEPIEPLLNMPLAFTKVVARCLEKDPSNRFQSVGELACALGTCINRSPLPAQFDTATPLAMLATCATTTDAQVSTTLGGASSGGTSTTRAMFASGRTLLFSGVAAILVGVGSAIVFSAVSYNGCSNDAGHLSTVGSSVDTHMSTKPEAVPMDAGLPSIAQSAASEDHQPRQSAEPTDAGVPPIAKATTTPKRYPWRNAEATDAGVLSIAKPATAKDRHLRQNAESIDAGVPPITAPATAPDGQQRRSAELRHTGVPPIAEPAASKDSHSRQTAESINAGASPVAKPPNAEGHRQGPPPAYLTPGRETKEKIGESRL